MSVRAAADADVEAMVALSEQFRARLQTLSPVFWRKAADSAEKHAVWFRILLTADGTFALVHDGADAIDGFIIGRMTPAPPVYAPGGPICLVDDFCVSEDDGDWTHTGRALLEATEGLARERGAVLSVVVCPHLGGAKREFLASLGFAPTSEWHVRAL